MLRATQLKLHSMFCALFLKIVLSAAELMSFGHLGSTIWRFLKDNMREGIGEIQLHAIDNVLKNWTDRVGYCMDSRDSHLNEITSYY